MPKIRYLVALCSLALPGIAAAQTAEPDFRLFEDVEANASAAASRRRVTGQSSGGSDNVPAFTLQGTSRIGEKYKAVLLNKDGTTVTMAVIPSSGNSIEGYSGFSVVDIGAGSVSIQMPDDSPCIEATARGVRCSESGNIAILGLVSGKAMPARESSTANPRNSAGVDSEPDGEITNTAPINPFAALRAANDAEANTTTQASPAAPARFTPRRIPPEDVPPGKRVVQTPFGDRLIDQ